MTTDEARALAVARKDELVKELDEARRESALHLMLALLQEDAPNADLSPDERRELIDRLDKAALGGKA
jgi:hypothetical protein